MPIVYRTYFINRRVRVRARIIGGKGGAGVSDGMPSACAAVSACQPIRALPGREASNSCAYSQRAQRCPAAILARTLREGSLDGALRCCAACKGAEAGFRKACFAPMEPTWL